MIPPGDSPKTTLPLAKSSLLQRGLNRFLATRRAIVTTIAYATLRLYGSEVTWISLRDQKFPSPTGEPPDLKGAVAPELLLTAARDALSASEKRRDTVVEKSKTLLTIASFIGGILGLLLPKSLKFGSMWLQLLFYIAALALMNTIVMLLEMLSVRKAMFVRIESADAKSVSRELNISLAESYLNVRADTDAETDYIVEIYKGARFSFLCAFTLVWAVFTINYFQGQSDYEANAVAKELRNDPKFVEAAMGAKGAKGEPGEKGDKGERGERGDRGEKGDRGEGILKQPGDKRRRLDNK